MKKWLRGLAIITCVFALTACGSSEDTAPAADSAVTEADAIAAGENIVTQIDEIVAGGMVDQYEDNTVVYSALTSWTTAKEDIGTVEGFQEESAEITDDGITINIGVAGSDHDATVVIIYDEDNVLSSITTNVNYSIAEMMEQAALNTVLGMGTTFAVLILISLLISLFPLVNKLQTGEKKDKKAAQAPAPAAPAVAEPAVEEVPEDDTELIAVIAAAIAASEGRTSTDGFVVRSIRKASRRNWKF
ncbi:MAG: OadG family transporter subunit [Eubacteriales bacterium]|nr:OadG family transporter subunit [Eubacteriales bacterium]